MSVFWAFDLDGTLVTSQIDYGFAELTFARLMLETFEHLAPHYQRILDLAEGLDKERFQVMWAHRLRFPGSLVVAYHGLCRRTGVAVDSQVEQEVWRIGFSALSEKTYRNRSMIPGAEEVLAFLQKRGDKLFCVTFGDEEVQRRKWRGYRLGRFFPTSREFIVVSREKLPALQELRRLAEDSPAVMVGDSIGSDIVPAVAVGMVPIYIPHPSVWEHGGLVKELPKEALQLGKIEELIQFAQNNLPTG